MRDLSPLFFLSFLTICALAACTDGTPDPEIRKAEPAEISLPPDPLMKGRNSHIIGVNHVGLTVSDLDEQAKYFEKAAQMMPIEMTNTDLPSIAGAKNLTGGRMQVLRGVNSFLRLMTFDDIAPAYEDGELPVQGPGITHICFIAPKSRPIDAGFIRHGGKWVSSGGAMVDMRGTGYMYGYLRSVDGTMIEIEHANEPKIDVDVWMSHAAIVTHDLTRLLAYYETVLGYPHYRRVNDISGPTFDEVGGLSGANIDGAWFRIAPYYGLEFWQYNQPATEKRQSPQAINQRGYNMIAFETTDIEADFKRLRGAGIALPNGIEKSAGGRSFYLRDPDGNLLAFTQFEDGSPLSLRALNLKMK